MRCSSYIARPMEQLPENFCANPEWALTQTFCVQPLWAQTIIVRGAFRFATMPFIFFLAQSAAVLARTFTESDFLRHFVLFHMLFWIGALIILKEEIRARPLSQNQRTQAKIRRSLLRR